MTAQQDSRSSARRKPLIKPAARIGEYRTFFSSAFHNPKQVGAATPTSAAVADVVAQVVPTTGRPVVVELGPGTGSLSSGIRQRLPAEARHIGIEVVASMVEHLRVHAQWMELVHGDAGELVELLAQRGIEQVDAVITSIPWSLLEDTEQDRILRQAAEALAPHGAFTALTYVPAEHNSGGRRFRTRLADTFDEVLTHTTWRNFPPILHYICLRPLR